MIQWFWRLLFCFSIVRVAGGVSLALGAGGQEPTLDISATKAIMESIQKDRKAAALQQFSAKGKKI